MGKSTIYNLNVNDVLKGIIIAIGTPVLLIVQQTLDSGQLSFNWKQISMAAIGGFITYLSKNFFSGNK